LGTAQEYQARLEAQDIAETGGPETEQTGEQTGIARYMRNLYLQDKQRDGDGKDAVAERLDPLGTALRAPGCDWLIPVFSPKRGRR
jgi:hypothetical protein